MMVNSKKLKDELLLLCNNYGIPKRSIEPVIAAIYESNDLYNEHEIISKELYELKKCITGYPSTSFKNAIETVSQLQETSYETATHISKCGRYRYKDSGFVTSYRKYFVQVQEPIMLFWDTYSKKWRQSNVKIKNLNLIID